MHNLIFDEPISPEEKALVLAYDALGYGIDLPLTAPTAEASPTVEASPAVEAPIAPVAPPQAPAKKAPKPIQPVYYNAGVAHFTRTSEGRVAWIVSLRMGEELFPLQAGQAENLEMAKVRAGRSWRAEPLRRAA